MVFKLAKVNREDFLFFAIFVVTGSGAFGITNTHRDIFSVVRNVSVILIVAAFFMPSIYAKMSAINRPQNFKFMLLYMFFILYGIILSFLWGGSDFFYEDVIRDIFIVLSLLYAFSLFQIVSAVVDDNRRWNQGIPAYSLYIILSMLFALATGGITLSPLVLNFETAEGGIALYAQGFTKLCAIAGVYFFVIATNVERRTLWLYAIPAIFFMLSILGGSRGDILAGFFALGFFLLRRPNALNIGIVVTGALSVFVLIIQSGIGAGFTVFNRFRDLSEGDYSLRDLLFGQAVDTIWGAPCTLSGCGFNFFQLWHNYEFGLYPHNVFLESIITFGVFFGGAAVLLSIYGAFVLYLKIGKSPIYYLLLVDFFTLQKSSSLIDPSTLPTLLCFAWFGARALFRGYSSVGPQSAYPHPQ